MMQKRTLYSLLLISFMVVFGWSLASANEVAISSATLSRCAHGTLNVTADVTEDSVSAVEVVLVISKTTGCAFTDSLKVVWNPAFTELPDRIVDVTKVNGTSADTIRFAAMRLSPSGQVLKKGLKVLATLTFKASDCCGGTATIDGGEFTYPNPTSPIVTQFVNAATLQIVPAAVKPGVVTITNSAPVLAFINDTTLHWGQTYAKTASATDADNASGCEAVTYSKLAGPAAMTVNSSTGAIFWATQKADVCVSTVSILASDKCGAADTATFTICVQNTAPTFTTCPGTQVMVNGDVLTAATAAIDPDDAAAALIFTKLSGPTWASVNSTTGLVTLSPAPPDVAPGTYAVCVKVSDGLNTCVPCSPSNADTCCFNVEVRTLGIAIQKQHGQGGKGVQWGTETTVDIQKLPGSNYPIGGYDFLIQYDNSVLTLLNATVGTDLTACKWEYFTFRFGPFGNCGSGCPSGMVKLVAIAETNNGTPRPSCYLETDGSIAQLAQLTFLVKNDRNLECMFVPVRFIWLDCTDNGLSNKAGDTLMISHHVYDWVEDGLGHYVSIEGQGDGTFPTIYGAPASCNVQTPKGYPFRMVDFYNGGVDIACAKDLDDRGDINMNGVAYEISDAVMFTNYFIQGVSAFLNHAPGSMAASDVNGDGLTLTVADLVYLIRVVVGDAAPLPKPTLVTVDADGTYEKGVLSVRGGDPMAAAFVIAKGNVTPTLESGAATMALSYEYSSETNQTRILVHPPISESGATLTSFTGDFLNLNGAEIVGNPELATITGQAVKFTLVPTNYALNQNYPNPFNPSTKISFDLPKAGAWTLTVFNIQGQVVDSYSGVADKAGSYDVTFHGENRSSGMYLYKLVAGEYSSTKKMVMIK